MFGFLEEGIERSNSQKVDSGSDPVRVFATKQASGGSTVCQKGGAGKRADGLFFCRRQKTSRSKARFAPTGKGATIRMFFNRLILS